MTKAEELKLLDKIAELIDSAGTDSYIHDTFAGVVDICRNNIVNDFGDHPVADLNLERLRRENDKHNMDALIKAKDAEIERLKNRLMPENRLNATTGIDRVAELEKDLEQTGADVNGWMEECHKKDAEIMRLKAELYDYMRKEREQ